MRVIGSTVSEPDLAHPSPRSAWAGAADLGSKNDSPGPPGWRRRHHNPADHANLPRGAHRPGQPALALPRDRVGGGRGQRLAIWRQRVAITLAMLVQVWSAGGLVSAIPELRQGLPSRYGGVIRRGSRQPWRHSRRSATRDSRLRTHSSEAAIAIGSWGACSRRNAAGWASAGCGVHALFTLEDSTVARRLGSSSLEDRVELLEAVGPAAAMQLQPLLGGELALSQCHGRPPVEEVQ